jgi:uncharacterized protein
VVESLLQGISDGKWNDLADLYAEDAVVEMPVAPSSPTRLEDARRSGRISLPRREGL